MYARNITTFLLHLAPKGELVLNREDEITRESLVTHEGQIVHPKVAELAGAVLVGG
jgi:H+-translocating NAD(P) transhydrogenase subunit alpha